MSFDFSYAKFDTSYCQSGALQYGLFVTILLATVCFVLTKLTNEYSWVDRMWSLLPPFYACHFLLHQSYCRKGQIHQRQWIMFGLVWLWGLRLTYNFYRKGGYQKGGEDYRWEYIRKNYHPIAVELLNLLFTAYIQLVIIYLFSAPIYLADGTMTNSRDYGLLVVYLVLLAVETIADNQQWAFQLKKKELQAKDKKHVPIPYSLGFITTGLFKYSRHPNFFSEMCIWWVYFLFTVNSVGWNLSWIGTLLLTLLFQGSTALTEKISSEKYRMYAQYQKVTSRFMPLPSEGIHIRKSQ